MTMIPHPQDPPDSAGTDLDRHSIPLRLGFKVAGLIWIVSTIFGMGVLINYELSPGETAPPSADWPIQSTLTHAPDSATLVMFVHPRCACSRASLGELARLIAQCGDQVQAHVFFFSPGDAEADWAKTDLWRSAAAIPGVAVAIDVDGLEASRFVATISGQTFLYDAGGRLVFDGGITASRSHFGDNAGRAAITAFALEGSADLAGTPVFGCSILDPESPAREEAAPWTI